MHPARICYAAFKPVALTEINEGVPAGQVNELLRQIDNPTSGMWSGPFSAWAFSYIWMHSSKSTKTASKHKQWTDAYFALLKFYDEFGYLEREKFHIYLDSKENFDTNYQGNWYYYYK